MKTTFADHETYGQYIKRDEACYYGISQGGIMGTVILGLTNDVERGALGVPGMPYSLLLFRSVDFDIFLTRHPCVLPGLSNEPALDRHGADAVGSRRTNRLHPPHLREHATGREPERGTDARRARRLAGDDVGRAHHGAHAEGVPSRLGAARGWSSRQPLGSHDGRGYRERQLPHGVRLRSSRPGAALQRADVALQGSTWKGSGARGRSKAAQRVLEERHREQPLPSNGCGHGARHRRRRVQLPVA